jgi:hypothetical protein
LVSVTLFVQELHNCEKQYRAALSIEMKAFAHWVYASQIEHEFAQFCIRCAFFFYFLYFTFFPELLYCTLIVVSMRPGVWRVANLLSFYLTYRYDRKYEITGQELEFRSSECALESALRNCFGDTPLEIFELEQQLQREGGGGSSSSGRGGRSRRRLKQAQTQAGASGGGGVDRYNPTKNGGSGGAPAGINPPHGNGGGGGGGGSAADRAVDRSSGSDNAATDPESLDWFPGAGEGTFLRKVPSKLSQGTSVHTHIHTYIHSLSLLLLQLLHNA